MANLRYVTNGKYKTFHKEKGVHYRDNSIVEQFFVGCIHVSKSFLENTIKSTSYAMRLRFVVYALADMKFDGVKLYRSGIQAYVDKNKDEYFERFLWRAQQSDFPFSEAGINFLLKNKDMKLLNKDMRNNLFLLQLGGLLVLERHQASSNNLVHTIEMTKDGDEVLRLISEEGWVF